MSTHSLVPRKIERSMSEWSQTSTYWIMHRQWKRNSVSGEFIFLFRSYLMDPRWNVRLRNKFSSTRTISSGVPQGSGSLLFSVHNSQYQEFITCCHLHTFADDFQLYYDYLIDNIHYTRDNAAFQHFLMLNPKKLKIPWKTSS